MKVLFPYDSSMNLATVCALNDELTQQNPSNNGHLLHDTEHYLLNKGKVNKKRGFAGTFSV